MFKNFYFIFDSLYITCKTYIPKTFNADLIEKEDYSINKVI